MKSKTCYFNLTLYKKNVTHFWPIWLLYFACLLLRLPVSIWVGVVNYTSWDYATKEAGIRALSDALCSGISATPLFLVSVLAAMAVFSYLHKARTANMFHALPVNRKELFVTNYISGLLCLVVPQILTFVISVFVCLANQITCMQYLFYWLLYVVGITFFAYSMAVFVGMITGQIFAVPVYFCVANFLYVGIRYILSLIIGLICYGIEPGWRPGYSGMLSPWYFLERHLQVETIYNSTYETCTGLKFSGGKYLVIYAVVALVFVAGAWLLYRKRQIETAGDVISVEWVKPIFRWGIALAGGSLLAVFTTNALLCIRNIPIFKCTIIGVIIYGFLFFFAAEMFLKKSFKVLVKKRFIEWGAFTLVAIAFFAVFRFDVFGFETRIPKAETIEKAYLSLDYPVEYTQENMEELLSIHEDFLKKKNEYRDLYMNDVSYVMIKYYLKGGDVITRQYPIPLNSETIHNPDDLVEKVLDIEQQSENILSEVFGVAYESNQYMSGYVELTDQNMNMSLANLSADDAQLLVNAVIEDIKAGNLRNIVDSYDLENAPKEYYNAISFSVFNKEDIYTTSEYYYNYDLYTGKTYHGTASKEVYINFNENCKNILQAIEELGIVTDEWGLKLYDDYYYEETVPYVE